MSRVVASVRFRGGEQLDHRVLVVVEQEPQQHGGVEDDPVDIAGVDEAGEPVRHAGVVPPFARQAEEPPAVRGEGVEEGDPVAVERAVEPEVVPAHVATDPSFVSCMLTYSTSSPLRAPCAANCEQNVVFPLPGAADNVQAILREAAVDESVEPGNAA